MEQQPRVVKGKLTNVVDKEDPSQALQRLHKLLLEMGYYINYFKVST